MYGSIAPLLSLAFCPQRRRQVGFEQTKKASMNKRILVCIYACLHISTYIHSYIHTQMYIYIYEPETFRVLLAYFL